MMRDRMEEIKCSFHTQHFADFCTIYTASSSQRGLTATPMHPNLRGIIPGVLP